MSRYEPCRTFSRAVIQRTVGRMMRHPEDVPDGAVVLVNPDDEVTPERFRAWLDERQRGEPLDLAVTAADTLAEARADGEV